MTHTSPPGKPGQQKGNVNMNSNPFPEGNAIVYCEGAFHTTNGKTAHGLVRMTHRYNVISVIDSTCAGKDAGQLLDGSPSGIPIVATLDEALTFGRDRKFPLTHFVIGLAPDGGRMAPYVRAAILRAIRARLHVDSGLHDFLVDDAVLTCLAATFRVRLRDIRKPPPRNQLHAFTGKIQEVTSARIAVLGTDSAVGKRTTAWKLVDALNTGGCAAEFIGTGQTAWMQGAEYGIILDSLINDFVAGEVEHAVWTAWSETHPAVIVVEGQGSLMNPAYPGGFEILAAARPHFIVLQHAPARAEYDGFPGYPLHPLERQIDIIERLSNKPVVAVTLNHEGLTEDEIPDVCAEIERTVGRPVFDVVRDGAVELALAVQEATGSQVSSAHEPIAEIQCAT